MKRKIVTRKEDIETLIEIIENREDYKENSKNGLVILLNGEWGTGKTTFLNEFIEKMNGKENIELFSNYNAYENDYYENAYIPFFAAIEDKLQLKNEFSNFIKSVGEYAGKGVLIGAYAIMKSIAKTAINIDIDDIKENIVAIEEEKINNDCLNDYNNAKKYKKQIKERMNELCANKSQIFIIDELDRCKPNFAMDTLEIVKHFFDISNCVFIISVDKIQLEESIKSIYGNGINSEKYFSKLFDYQFNLLPINFYEAIDFYQTSITQDLINEATKIFNILNISLRDSKKVFNELIKKNQSWTIEQSLFILFLLILKYTDLSFYNAILKKDYIRYKKIFEQSYNKELEKYNKIMEFKIGRGLTYGEILEELHFNLDKNYAKLGSNFNNISMMIKSKNKSIIEIEEDILEHIPEYNIGLSVKENIKRIVG